MFFQNRFLTHFAKIRFFLCLTTFFLKKVIKYRVRAKQKHINPKGMMAKSGVLKSLFYRCFQLL